MKKVIGWFTLISWILAGFFTTKTMYYDNLFKLPNWAYIVSVLFFSIGVLLMGIGVWLQSKKNNNVHS